MMWLGTEYDEALYDELKSKYGLDKSLIHQYWIWLENVLKGDLGKSLLTHTSISEEIRRQLPVTLELVGLSMAFAIIIGVLGGIVSALYHNRPVDNAALTITLFGISMPEFFLGAVLMLVFSLHWPVLPATGFVRISEDWVANLRHMIMPALALGFARSAVICRLMRSSLLEVFGKHFIRTALAKGCTVREVLTRHALKNALISVVTVIGMQVGYLMGGAIIVEQLFVIPGIGSFGINAILSRDYPGIQAFILTVAVFFVFVNLLVDLSYSVIDPRIRGGGGRGR